MPLSIDTAEWVSVLEELIMVKINERLGDIPFQYFTTPARWNQYCENEVVLARMRRIARANGLAMHEEEYDDCPLAFHLLADLYAVMEEPDGFWWLNGLRAGEFSPPGTPRHPTPDTEDRDQA